LIEGAEDRTADLAKRTVEFRLFGVMRATVIVADAGVFEVRTVIHQRPMPFPRIFPFPHFT